MVVTIKGNTVTLVTYTENGEDDFGHAIRVATTVEVPNVLIEPASNDAIVSEMELYGKRIAYVLHIPKSDSNNWKDAEVILPAPWNVTLKTYGDALVYAPHLAPLAWNKKVKAELYE